MEKEKQNRQEVKPENQVENRKTGEKETLSKILLGAGMAISAISNANAQAVNKVTGNLTSDHPILSQLLATPDSTYTGTAYRECNHYDNYTYQEGACTANTDT